MRTQTPKDGSWASTKLDEGVSPDGPFYDSEAAGSSGHDPRDGRVIDGSCLRSNGVCCCVLSDGVQENIGGTRI